MASARSPSSSDTLLPSLAARASHDLNNLIAVLSGHLYLLALPGGTGSADSIEALRKAVEQVERLSRNLGALGVLGAGEPAPLSLNDVARRAAARPEHPAVSLDLGEDLPAIPGRSCDLEAAVGCLLANAAEASAPGAETVLRTTQDASAGDLLLSVTDSGRGVAPEIEGRVFDPFFSTKGGRGTGIGLFLVATVAAAHGATCRLESRPGEGTRVELRFPARLGR
jgi:signal transduction histidine kinase